MKNNSSSGCPGIPQLIAQFDDLGTFRGRQHSNLLISQLQHSDQHLRLLFFVQTVVALRGDHRLLLWHLLRCHLLDHGRRVLLLGRLSSKMLWWRLRLARRWHAHAGRRKVVMELRTTRARHNPGRRHAELGLRWLLRHLGWRNAELRWRALLEGRNYGRRGPSHSAHLGRWLLLRDQRLGLLSMQHRIGHFRVNHSHHYLGLQKCVG